MVWRARLLEFVLETRNIIKLSKEAAKEKEKEDSLKNLIFQLEEKFISTEEGGVAVSDSALRERLVNDLVDLRSDVKGADGVKKGDAPLIFLYLVLTLPHSVLEGDTVTVRSVAGLLQEVYLDPGVWDRLERLYTQFLSRSPALPALAVLLSIL